MDRRPSNPRPLSWPARPRHRPRAARRTAAAARRTAADDVEERTSPLAGLRATVNAFCHFFAPDCGNPARQP